MKALIVTSVASMVDQFLKPSIEILQNMGYEVVVACNFDDCGTITQERCAALKQYLMEKNVAYKQVDFPRNPLKINKIIGSFKQMKSILQVEVFSLCHCHSPIGGLVTRLTCKRFRKEGLKVIYTAHGFHFYKGAPLKNWLIYYPIEKICSNWTDVLITINNEDFELAQKRMKAKRVEYVPGIGIDIKRFSDVIVDRENKRNEIGVPKDAKMLLSVGELNENKNHRIVIEALGKLEDSSIHYVIAGVGNQKENLESLAKENKVNLHLLGYRNDVTELYKCADLYVHPSKREGLPVALMEAMASEVSCIASRIRGCEDILSEGLFFPTDINQIMEYIVHTPNGKSLDSRFSLNELNQCYKAIYKL